VKVLAGRSQWLFRYLEAADDATIRDAEFVAANSQALGGREEIKELRSRRVCLPPAVSRGGASPGAGGSSTSEE
jgi:hypothetical protein